MLVLLALGVGCVAMDPLHFNAPPSPPKVGITPESPTTLDDLVGGIVEEAVDEEEDPLVYAYTWYRDGELQAGNTVILSSARTTRDEEWRIEATAFDGEWYSEVGSATVTIVNSPPAISAAAISPNAPYTTDNLTLDVDAGDPDDDTVTLTIHWFADDVEVPSISGDQLVPAALTMSGQVWRATVTPSDGQLTGAVATAETKIDNTAPVLTGVLIYPSEPVHGDTLATGTQGLFDADGDPLEVTYTWMIGGRVVSTETTSGVAYYTGDVEKDYQFSVNAQASDGFATSGVVTSDVVTVINSAPTATGVSLSPSVGYEDSTLTCSGEGASDVDSDSVSFDYSWSVNGTALSRHDETLDGTYFSRGDDVTCTATPTDDDLDGPSFTSSSVAIENTLPTLSSVDLSTASPTKLTGISCTPSGFDDADGDPTAYTYAWYQNGTKVGTSTSVSGSTLSRGTSVYVEETPYDSYGNGTSVKSSTVLVANSAPTLSSAQITPSPAYTDSTLTCSPSGYSDSDGDTAVYTYAWYKNGTVTTDTGATMAGSNFVKTDRLYCNVTPSDGYDSGTTVKTPVVTVSNSAPTLTAGLLSSSSVQECDEIQLDASSAADADADALTYAWTISTKPAASSMATTDFDTSTAVSPYVVVDAAGTFTFQAAVSDGSTSGSDTVDVTVAERPDNTAPVADAGADQTEALTTTCTTSGGGTYCPPCPTNYFYLDASGTTDDDGDPIRYTWSYTVSGGSGASIDSTTSETPMITTNPLGTSYGTTTTMTVTTVLTARDCAGGRDTDALTISYTCQGI